jgi:uncharacterized protein YndB with AHSA1/START domain
MRTLMKWLLIAVAGLAALLFAGGLALSGEFRAVRSTQINAPADKVYALVADPREWKRWSVWNQRDPAMAITYSGPPSGAGAIWEWKSKSEDDGRMTFTVADPGKRLAFELFFPDFGTTTTGVLDLAPAGAATQVTWTMNGNMGRNPVYRWNSWTGW